MSVEINKSCKTLGMDLASGMHPEMHFLFPMPALSPPQSALEKRPH